MGKNMPMIGLSKTWGVQFWGEMKDRIHRGDGMLEGSWWVLEELQ